MFERNVTLASLSIMDARKLSDLYFVRCGNSSVTEFEDARDVVWFLKQSKYHCKLPNRGKDAKHEKHFISRRVASSPAQQLALYVLPLLLVTLPNTTP